MTPLQRFFYVQCLRLFFFSKVVVAVVLVSIGFFSHFDASQFLGFVFNFYGGTAAAVFGVAILFVGVLHFARRQLVVQLSYFVENLFLFQYCSGV